MCGDVFFDHVEEVEGDAAGLAVFFVEGSLGFWVPVGAPGEFAGEVVFAEFLEDFAHALHEEGEVAVEFVEADF